MLIEVIILQSMSQTLMFMLTEKIVLIIEWDGKVESIVGNELTLTIDSRRSNDFGSHENRFWLIDFEFAFGYF